MELLLNSKEVIELGNDLCGTRICCRAGLCWVTLEGDSRDHILRAGSSFEISRSGRVLLTALTPARVLLAELAQQSRLFEPEPSGWGWLKKRALFNAKSPL